jgi:hypothetical protein
MFATAPRVVKILFSFAAIAATARHSPSRSRGRDAMATVAVTDTPMSDEPVDPEFGEVQVRAARARASSLRR